VASPWTVVLHGVTGASNRSVVGNELHYASRCWESTYVQTVEFCSESLLSLVVTPDSPLLCRGRINVMSMMRKLCSATTYTTALRESTYTNRSCRPRESQSIGVLVWPLGVTLLLCGRIQPQLLLMGDGDDEGIGVSLFFLCCSSIMGRVWTSFLQLLVLLHLSSGRKPCAQFLVVSTSLAAVRLSRMTN
jgi:hypothetical protein